MANTQGGLFQFPDINIPDTEKTEEYHKKFVYAIANRSINSNYDLDFKSVESCQDYYNGVQSNEAFDFLQFSEDGDRLPAFWVNYNKVKPKIDLLIGESSKKGYRVNLTSINRDSKIRKLEKREDEKIDLKLKPYINELEESFEIPLMPESKFDSEEDIDDFYNYSYKEKSENVMKSALDYSLKIQRWEYERQSLFRDLVITGRLFSKTELINGIPKTRRIDPKLMIWDRDATDDFLSDAGYFGEVRYMNLAEAAQKYNVTKKELQSAYASQKSAIKSNNPDKYNSINRILNNSSVSFFSNQQGELRVLIVEAYWVDYKRLTNKISKDKYGNEHIKTLSSETKEKKNIRSNYYKIWRKGVLIGGEFLKDWGETKNMPRSVDDPSDTGCPYKCLIPGYINYSSSSIVSRMQPLQDLKNISLYNLQLSMARAGGKGFVYDTSQTPEGWDAETVLKYLKTSGIAFINSKQDDGLPSSFNQFQSIDLSLGAEVNKYIEISMMVDREMDNITGINEARQGIIQNSSQAVGVTKSALMQSSLSTEMYFDFFRMYSSDVFSYMVGLIKIAWIQYKDRFSPIIGDKGIEFLLNDVDLTLDDYAVFIEDVPNDGKNNQDLALIVQAAMQNRQIDIVPAIKILTESDIDRGIQMLEREVAVKKKEDEKARLKAEEQAMQQQAMQQQAAQQQSMQEQQSSQQRQAMDIESKLESSNMKLNNDLKLISAKGKVDLINKK